MSTYSYGTFSMSSRKVGGGMVVFPRVDSRYQGGGNINISGTNPLTTKTFAAGDLIPAGTMVKFAGPGKDVTIVPNGTASSGLTGVNGLIEHDIVIPDGAVSVPCTVVRSGRVLADRVVHGNNTGLPAEAAALLPLIEFVREN